MLTAIQRMNTANSRYASGFSSTTSAVSVLVPTDSAGLYMPEADCVPSHVALIVEQGQGA